LAKSQVFENKILAGAKKPMIQPIKCRRKGLMPEILSQSRAVLWTQVFHFMCARGFDEPQVHARILLTRMNDVQ